MNLFKYLKVSGSEYDISRFKKGQKIDIDIASERGETIVKTYIVSEIEIHQIKYDIDEPTYGLNKNDCLSVDGAKKKWLMEIYIFLDLII